MTIEITAKKVEDAINQGLEQLGATADEVNVEVLDLGGLFRKAKVRLTLERAEKPVAEKKEADVKPEPKKEKVAPEKSEKKEQVKPAPEKKEQVKPAPQKESAKDEHKSDKERTEQVAPRNAEEESAAFAQAVEFIKEVVAKMGFTEAAVQAGEGGKIDITAPDRDDSLLIGRHGETLSALSYIAETCARADKHRISVTVDCNGYRDRRAASLTALAKRKANECVAKNRKIKLEAMERVDRRTVHNALTDDARVTTASEGKEPFRYVVILPKKQSKE